MRTTPFHPAVFPNIRIIFDMCLKHETLILPIMCIFSWIDAIPHKAVPPWSRSEYVSMILEAILYLRPELVPNSIDEVPSRCYRPFSEHFTQLPYRKLHTRSKFLDWFNIRGWSKRQFKIVDLCYGNVRTLCSGRIDGRQLSTFVCGEFNVWILVVAAIQLIA